MLTYRLAAAPLVVFALLLVSGLCGSSGGSGGSTPGTIPTVTPTVSAFLTAVPNVSTSTTGTGGGPTGSSSLSPFAAALSGLSCAGTWGNTTFGSTGSFSITGTGAGSTGALAITVGGNAFGASGGTVTLPYVISSQGQFTVNSDAGFLGHVQVTVDPSGTISGGMTAPPALGPNGKVSITSFSYANKALTAAVDIDFGNGSPHATSKVNATCK